MLLVDKLHAVAQEEFDKFNEKYPTYSEEGAEEFHIMIAQLIAFHNNNMNFFNLSALTVTEEMLDAATAEKEGEE